MKDPRQSTVTFAMSLGQNLNFWSCRRRAACRHREDGGFLWFPRRLLLAPKLTNLQETRTSESLSFIERVNTNFSKVAVDVYTSLSFFGVPAFLGVPAVLQKNGTNPCFLLAFF